jgi:hypothetical protein
LRRVGVFLVVLAAVAAGCGAEAVEQPADAAAKTEAALTWRFAYELHVSGPTGRQTQRGRGEQDAAREAMHSVEETTDAGGGEEIVNVSGKSFVRVDGDRWITSGDEDAGDALPFGFLGAPGNAIDLVHAARGDVQRKGEENVRGVQTLRSHVEVDLAELYALRAESADERGAVDDVAGSESDPIGVDLWVDAEGRLRRLAFEWAWSTSDGEWLEEGWIEFFDFGADVRIVEPANAEVIPPPECTFSGGSPIPSDRVVSALRSHGFEARVRKDECGERVTNADLDEVDGPPLHEGWVLCSVHEPGDPIVSIYFTSNAESTRRVELTIENVSCTLLVTGTGGDVEARFRAAIAELGR